MALRETWHGIWKRGITRLTLARIQMKLNENLKISFPNILIFAHRYTDEDNFELTNYIKTSVQGIAPDTSEEVIHGKF